MDERKLFGTDGIRGKANEHPMTPELAIKLGKAIALYIEKKGEEPKIVIGKDTRVSGYMLETALTSGLVSMGATVLLVGPMPTPAISHLTRSLTADAGIVISASHNPAGDNGIKIFNSKGLKLKDSEEQEIERIIFSEEMNSGSVNGKKIGKAFRVEDANGRYIEFVKNSINNSSLAGLKIVIDCANGAAYKIAPTVLEELEAEVISINDEPDGFNINKGCGATHIEGLQKKVVAEKADLGIAFDGDADRLILVDSQGEEINGDKIMASLAIYLKEKNQLKNNSIVATVMSNSALEKKLTENGITMTRTKVGDRYIIEEMLSQELNFGGEQSGHIIFGDYATTGDGILTALQMLKIMKETGKTASEAFNNFSLFPQVLMNVKVKEKKPLNEMPLLIEKIKDFEGQLRGEGRILVRYSGTENIARIMVEGNNEKKIKEIAELLSLEFKKVIGE